MRYRGGAGCLQPGAVGMSGVDADLTLEAEALRTGRTTAFIPEMEKAAKLASRR